MWKLRGNKVYFWQGSIFVSTAGTFLVMYFLKYLNISPKKIKKNVQKELFIAMSDSEQKLYDILKSHGKLHIDQLALRMGIATYQLMPILLDLEFKNIIEPLPGKYYDLN